MFSVLSSPFPQLTGRHGMACEVKGSHGRSRCSHGAIEHAFSDESGISEPPRLRSSAVWRIRAGAKPRDTAIRRIASCESRSASRFGEALHSCMRTHAQRRARAHTHARTHLHARSAHAQALFVRTHNLMHNSTPFPHFSLFFTRARVHARTHTHTHTHTHARTHAHARTHTHAHPRTHTHNARTHACTRTHARTRTHTSTHAARKCTHARAHTHTHRGVALPQQQHLR